MRFTAHKQHLKHEQQLEGSPASADPGLPLSYAYATELDPTMQWNDETLVQALKRRDSGAVQYAVEIYAPKLYRYATYQTGDAEVAEDIVSEVITRMLEKIDTYNYTGAPFQTWLFSIARNLIADLYRRKKRARVLSLDGDGASEAAELGIADSRLDGLADREALVQAMSRLTDEQRQIVTLRLVEGWEPAEIARLLGRSIDSVKSLQYRALQAMKRSLEAGS